MNNPQNDQSNLQKPLRLWPGVVLVILQLVSRYVVPIIEPEAMPYGLLGSVVATLLIVVWWVFFSRAPWRERLGGLALMIAAVLVTSRLVHISILNGAMGMLFYILVIPLLCTALVVWAVLTRNLSNRVRRVSMVMTILLVCGVWTLIRTGGFSGEFKHDFHWRWTETPEERLLAQSQDVPSAIPPASVPAKPAEKPQAIQTQQEPAALPSTAASSTPKEEASEMVDDSAAVPAASPEPVTQAEWPGFRGPERDGIIRGVRINTDWAASPPVELWRRPVGPAWSSFSVQRDHFFTQEQRGEEEVISCYNMETGEPVWMHRDSARFWESNAGAGPRGTPTLHNGRVYALGATGILNALNAADGSVVWSRNAASDTKTETPHWGFASSPLVVDDLVIVAISGQLAGYDIANGNPRWFGPKGKTDYSSPHLLNINGVTQILLLSGSGAVSVTPATGAKLWEEASPAGARIVQPAITTDGDLLISQGDQRGLRRVAVAKGSNGWNVKEHWTSNGLKPYFSDFVIHNDHAYGFDGNFLSCIDLKNGERKWKGGRYGSGQLVLLADQDLLLVLSEKGELALVSADTDQFKEVAKAPAIQGKTWNHPVLVGNVVLVRNGEEMAAFRVSSDD